ncbi:MAG: HlyD family secretion protein [Ardenticatenaceae bacterium]
MRRILIGAAVLALLVAVAYVGANYWNAGAPSEAAARPDENQTEPTPLPAVQASGEIVAEARVVPVQSAALSLPTGGIVAEVVIAEGEPVEAGEVILRLDSAQQQAAVAQAEANVAQAEAAVAQAEAAVAQAEAALVQAQLGVTQAEAGVAQTAAAITQAEAGVRRAEAYLAELNAGPRPQEIAAAQAGVAAANAQLALVSEGPRPEEVTAAQASVDAAQAALEEVQAGPAEEQLIAARADLENARAAVQVAQAAYDQVAHRADIGRLPQSLQLQQATNNFNAANAYWAELTGGASEATVRSAEAQVQQASAQLGLVQAPASGAQFDAANAEINQAQAQLELVRAGARPQTITAAEADVTAMGATLASATASQDAAETTVATANASVDAAEASLNAAEASLNAAEASQEAMEAALEQARVILAETELRAPFAGTVAALNATVGEQVAPATPVVQLADLSEWQIETDDLTELNVVELQEDDPVIIRFDALPGVELPGTVKRIESIGENRQGDITYTVIIQPEEHDPRLRWNMTAAVVITPEE